MKKFKVYEALKLLAENPNLKFKIKIGDLVITLEPNALGYGYNSKNELNTVGFYNINLNSIAMLENGEIK